MENPVSADLVMSMIERAKDIMAREAVDCETNCDNVWDRACNSLTVVTVSASKVVYSASIIVSVPMSELSTLECRCNHLVLIVRASHVRLS